MPPASVRRWIPNAPTAWNLYIGTDDIEALAGKVTGAGGTVVMAPFDVGDQGRMAVFQDPAGAFISAWQGTRMGGFQTDAPNSFGWAELNARGVDKAIAVLREVFGWTVRTSEMGEGQPPYTEFLLDGQSIAGAWEMSPMVPAEVPSYWQIYFSVEDVDARSRRRSTPAPRRLCRRRTSRAGGSRSWTTRRARASACSGQRGDSPIARSFGSNSRLRAAASHA